MRLHRGTGLLALPLLLGTLPGQAVATPVLDYVGAGLTCGSVTRRDHLETRYETNVWGGPFVMTGVDRAELRCTIGFGSGTYLGGGCHRRDVVAADTAVGIGFVLATAAAEYFSDETEPFCGPPFVCTTVTWRDFGGSWRTRYYDGRTLEFVDNPSVPCATPGTDDTAVPSWPGTIPSLGPLYPILHPWIAHELKDVACPRC